MLYWNKHVYTSIYWNVLYGLYVSSYIQAFTCTYLDILGYTTASHQTFYAIVYDSIWFVAQTQVSLKTMRYKGRDSASWIGRLSSWSNYRRCFFIGRVNDHERADEPNFQGEYNGVPGQRKQPNQWLRTYDRIQHSNRPDLQKKQRKKSNNVEPTIEPAKQPSSSNEFQILNRNKYHHQLQHKSWSWILMN